MPQIQRSVGDIISGPSTATHSGLTSVQAQKSLLTYFNSGCVGQALAAEALEAVVFLLRPDRARVWTHMLELSEEELLVPACAHLVPALIQAAGPTAARAHGAVATALVDGMTLPTRINVARKVTSLSAAAAAVLRAFCEGVACRQENCRNTRCRVLVAAQALMHGLTAVEAVAVEVVAQQRQRRHRQSARHPPSPIEVGQTVGALIHNAAAALAAIMLQCTAAEAVALPQCGAVQHTAQSQPPHGLSQSDSSQQGRGQQRANSSNTQPARGEAGTSIHLEMATVEQLTDWGVLDLLTTTIKMACARGWSNDALLPIVSALLVVGTYVSEASVAGRPDCPGTAPVAMHGSPSRAASSDAASTGGTAAAAAKQPAAWIDETAAAAAGGCAALVKATVKLHLDAPRTGGPRAGVMPQAGTVHGLGMMAAGCLTLAQLVSSPWTSGAALREGAAPRIFEGLQLVSMTPDCAEIAGMVVPCCRALAITFSLVTTSGGGGGGSGAGCRTDDEREAAPGTERCRRDPSVLEAASDLAAAVRKRWSDMRKRLNTRCSLPRHLYFDSS